MHTTESILELLDANDRAVIEGLKTVDRVAGWKPTEVNFARSLLSQIAKWEETPARERNYPTPLSERQLESAWRLVKRYAATLARVANTKAEHRQRRQEKDRVEAEIESQDGTRGRMAAEERANEIAQLDW